MYSIKQPNPRIRKIDGRTALEKFMISKLLKMKKTIPIKNMIAPKNNLNFAFLPIETKTELTP
jgi:hypothetical protein